MSEDAPETDVEAKLNTLARWIADAEARAAEAAPIDLAGLDALTERTCTAVAALPADRRDALRPRLEEMLAGLDRLAAAFRDSGAAAGADPVAEGAAPVAEEADPTEDAGGAGGAARPETEPEPPTDTQQTTAASQHTEAARAYARGARTDWSGT